MLKTHTLNITPDILALISQIDEFKGAWRALGTLAPERLSALRHVATIESIGSSTRIEGSKLSDRDVDRLLAKLEIKSFNTRDEQDVAGYATVMETIFQSGRTFRLRRITLSNCTAIYCNIVIRMSDTAAIIKQTLIR